jgi:hypothetical protein
MRVQFRCALLLALLILLHLVCTSATNEILPSETRVGYNETRVVGGSNNSGKDAYYTRVFITKMGRQSICGGFLASLHRWGGLENHSRFRDEREWCDE